MFTERAYTHQGEFPGEEIQELRQFINPEFTHDLAPGGDVEIVLELSAFLQVIGGMYVSLQILAVGMHGAELLHVDGFTVQAFTFEADQGAVTGIDVFPGFAAFAQDEVHLVVNFAFMDQVKAAEVKSAHDLGFREGAVFAIGESEIPALQDWQFREDAAVDEIDEIKHSAQIWCKAFIK